MPRRDICFCLKSTVTSIIFGKLPEFDLIRDKNKYCEQTLSKVNGTSGSRYRGNIGNTKQKQQERFNAHFVVRTVKSGQISAKSARLRGRDFLEKLESYTPLIYSETL